jgi:hypothetical protein
MDGISESFQMAASKQWTFRPRWILRRTVEEFVLLATRYGWAIRMARPLEV